MSTALVATPLPDVAAVLLTLTAAPAGEAVILRTDVNGSRPVRLLPGQVPIGGSLTVRDYEAALTGPITYVIEGDVGLVSASTALEVTDRAVLSVPVRPALRSDVGIVTTYAETSESSSTTHWVPEREDPIVVAGPLHTRTGTAGVRVGTYPDAAAVRALAKAGDVVLLRQPSFAGLDFYGTVDRVDLVPVEGGALDVDWEARLTYTEVAAPSAPLLGAADWTLGDVPAVTPTLRDVALTFPTLRALAVGP